MYFLRTITITLTAALAAFSAGCSGREAPLLSREELFSLDIGRLEDQIALYNLDGDRGIKQCNIAMRDGFFYIADTKGAKIVRYTSYGDLLFMIYNDETNPRLSGLKPFSADTAATRWAVSYPLKEPGELAVDSRKHIYVRDRLPYELHATDEESGALLDSIILHFDENGRFLEYLGREGPGGAPFPAIEGIFPSVDDEFAVVCRLPTGWNVHWFSAGGSSLYLVRLERSMVPVPKDRAHAIPSLNGICAAPDSRRLFVKVDYYRDTFDGSTGARTGNEPDSSVLWIMNVESGAWERSFEVPFCEFSFMDGSRRETVRTFYSMIGAAAGGSIFFSAPVENGCSILITNVLSGQQHEERRAFLELSANELRFNTFNLSPDGILSALLEDDWKVKLVWWRTDKGYERQN
ncbi:MAG: hypothetical protein LBR16_08735 [Treponema sp.]|jgi:hypothetical protein|nr:hypothetical protein [Treponema sp.]